MLALAISVFSSIFIVELAPARLRRIVIPVIRLLASVPSVVYGLIGILVLVPFVGNHLITAAAEGIGGRTSSQLTGAGLSVAVVILTVMITPIMVALICEALASVPSSWREGAIALGVNPLRAMLAVTLRAARPAIVAAAVLATARALGEAIMISMVSGGSAFAPKPIDGADLPLRAAAHARLGRSSTTTKGSARRRSARRCTRSRCCCCSRRSCCRWRGYLIKLPLRKYQVRAMSTAAAPTRLRAPAGSQRSRPALLAAELALARPARARARVGRRASGCA